MSDKVLVTGGAGYVGSHACKSLARAGLTPVVYDNLETGNPWAVRWGPLERGDILDLSRLLEVFHQHRPIAVLHFAALSLVGESVRAPARYWRSNITGLSNVLDACRLYDVGRIVFSSTCAVYGLPRRVPIVEDTPTLPITPYGATKLAAERLLADYARAYGLRYAALRYFNAAGADPEGDIGEHREVETHLVPLLLEATLGRRPPLTVLGDDYPTSDGTAVRDYVHVSDLADAHVRALHRLADGEDGLVLNLGTGRGYSVREVLETARAVTGRPVPHEIGPRRPGDPPTLVADVEAARRCLGEGLMQRSSLPVILETAWRWHRDHAPRSDLG